MDRRTALASGLLGVAGLMTLQSETFAMTPQRTIKSLQIKDVTIGEGKPKLIVSIAEKTPAVALERARRLAVMPAVDLIEYRIDHLTDHQDPAQVAASVAEIVSAVERKPLLMTFRTKEEGGEAAIAPDAYARLYEASLQRSPPELIDLQHALCSSPPVAALLSRAKKGSMPGHHVLSRFSSDAVGRGHDGKAPRNAGAWCRHSEDRGDAP